MKKILSHLIVLLILFTGYCPSFLNGTHIKNTDHPTKILSNHQEKMDCCDGGMKEIVGIGTLRSIDKNQKLINVLSPNLQAKNELKINTKWYLPTHHSSPPHLKLTGTVIMRE